MAVGKGFFDQYSVFCVFGSVVGCVVVPLITQSVESVIFSAIVISLTATHLTKRATNHSDSSTKGNSQALIERRNSRKSKDKDKESGVSNNPRKRKSVPQTQANEDSPQCRKKREDDQRKFELAKQLEWERKQEEKREKKLKKKEERIRRKEQEKEEKEKEEMKLKQLREERLRAKQLENQKIHQEKGSIRTTPRTLRKQDHQHKQPAVKALGTTTGATTHVPLGDMFTRQRSQSEGSDSTPPSPPPSVWKVPEYVEPKWNPGKLTEKIEKKRKEETKLNNDVICERSKVTAPFNQLHNPVHTPPNPSFCKNQYMNQEKTQPTEPSGFEAVKALDRPEQQKPDNRQNQQASTTGYSSFSGLPNLLSHLQESSSPGYEGKSYSLFGRDEENVSVFRSPLTGH